MLLKCFSVYDEKACAYLPPFYLPNEALALRAFGDMVEDSNHAFSRHPADYTLYFLGSWDDEDAMLDQDKQVVATGLEVKASRKAESPDLFEEQPFGLEGVNT